MFLLCVITIRLCLLLLFRGSVLFCSVLFCSVLFCSVLFCSVLFCSVLVWYVMVWIIRANLSICVCHEGKPLLSGMSVYVSNPVEPSKLNIEELLFILGADVCDRYEECDVCITAETTTAEQ